MLKKLIIVAAPAVLAAAILFSMVFVSPFSVVSIEEATAHAENEDYRFRIIEDRHHDNAHMYSLYMPQMLLGNQWHNMEDKWTPKKSSARETIDLERNKTAARLLTRYAIIETVKE